MVIQDNLVLSTESERKMLLVSRILEVLSFMVNTPLDIQHVPANQFSSRSVKDFTHAITTTQIHKLFQCISADCISAERVTRTIFLYGVCAEAASVNAEVHTKLAPRLNQSRATAVP